MQVITPKQQLKQVSRYLFPVALDSLKAIRGKERRLPTEFPKDSDLLQNELQGFHRLHVVEMGNFSYPDTC